MFWLFLVVIAMGLTCIAYAMQSIPERHLAPVDSGGGSGGTTPPHGEESEQTEEEQKVKRPEWPAHGTVLNPEEGVQRRPK